MGGAFGLIALSLAIVGLYGVVSFAGGPPDPGNWDSHGPESAAELDLRMILANGISLITVGVVIGMVVALAAARLMRSLLQGVSPWDPLTFVAIALILLTATFVSSWIPAHRATRADPNVAPRCE